MRVIAGHRYTHVIRHYADVYDPSFEQYYFVPIEYGCYIRISILNKGCAYAQLMHIQRLTYLYTPKLDYTSTRQAHLDKSIIYL